MKRRTFLKIIGMGSLSFAPGCTSRPEKNLFSHVEAPEDMVTGKATWYASTCRECPAGCGILAKNREGRVIKVEGNPLHPINRGRLCMRGQASLQGVYNPDRIRNLCSRSRMDGRRCLLSRGGSHSEGEDREGRQKGPGQSSCAHGGGGPQPRRAFCQRPWKNGSLRLPWFLNPMPTSH